MNDEDQPPDPFDNLGDMMQGLAVLAAFNRSCYAAHLEQGFSVEESLQITVEMMRIQLSRVYEG